MATIKDLIGRGPDELEKMTLEELRQHCLPYLRIAEHVPVREENAQGEIDLSDGTDTTSPDGPTYKEKRRIKKPLNKQQMLEEIIKLAKLHGVDAGIPTPIK